MIKVELLTVGTELVGAVEHQDVLNDNAVGLAVILEFADLIGPGRSPVGDLEVFIFAVDELAPAGLVQTEDQVAVFLLVGSLNSSSVTGDDAVVIDADGEAGFLCLLDQPGGALGGVGVGVNPDGIAGIIRVVRCESRHAQTQAQCKCQQNG